MAIRQRLGRAQVISHPAPIFIADEACQLVLYAISKRLDGDGSVDNGEVIIQVDVPPAIPYGDENSATLPFDRGFPIFLEEGQVVYAVSPGAAEVTFSVIPAPLDVVGY